MNYRELCQDLVSELGISGGVGPTTVLNQTGEFRNVVRWIRDSNDWLNNLWRDWKFLWCQYDEKLTSAQAIDPSSGIKVREWDRDSFWLNFGTVTARKLQFVAWDEFRDRRSRPVSAGPPAQFTIRPDNVVLLDRAPAEQTPLHAEFYRRPPKLAVDGDIPILPADYHRLIICRAAIMYGNREAAGEIISGMEAEYVDMLEKLQSDQLEAFRNERMAGQDIHLEIGA